MAKIQLQIALDIGGTQRLLSIARQVGEYADLLEAGTPWILEYGMQCVRNLRAEFPEKMILADMKIMDGGYTEASLGFEAGAHLVTVLGVASNATITSVVRAAQIYRGQVMVDLIQASNQVQRAQEVIDLGADFIGLHTACDEQRSGKSLVYLLSGSARQVNAPLVVAGGVNLDNLAEVMAFSPAVVVIGSAVTGAANPAETARRIRSILDGQV